MFDTIQQGVEAYRKMCQEYKAYLNRLCTTYGHNNTFQYSSSDHENIMMYVNTLHGMRKALSEDAHAKHEPFATIHKEVGIKC